VIDKLNTLLLTVKGLFNIQSQAMKLNVLLLVIVTVFQFLVELALASALQSLLFIWGLLPTRPTVLDTWGLGESTIFILLAFIAIGTLKGLLLWASVYLAGSYGIGLEVRIRKMVTRSGLESRYTETGNIADLFNDKAVHSASFCTLLINLANRSFIAVALLAYLFFLAPMNAFIACFCLALLSIPMLVVNRKLLKTSGEISQGITKALSTLLLGVKNSILLHIYGTTDKELHKTEGYLNQYRVGYLRYFALSGIKSSVPIIFGVWFIGFLTLTATLTSSVTPEVLVAFLYLFTRFVGSVSEVANISSQVAMTYPRARHLTSFFRAFHESEEVSGQGGKTLKPNEVINADFLSEPFGVRLRNVFFDYNGSDSFLIDNLSLDVKPLSVMAIVGPSGVGKSTLLSLMLGLQTPKSGIVEFYNEQGSLGPECDSRDIFLSKIGYVGPENFIIPGSIRDNLQYGAEAHTDEELWRALELSQSIFVKNLPGELDHCLTEQGEGLSAGQKQRLSIARALLRNPQFLILDEATSNMDVDTENDILEMLSTISERITMVIVTHRVTVTKIADTIVSMRTGGLSVKNRPRI
jgi:ABC-type bacteriocin/lantibiotic exporter with double-glycine peptidase domain